MATFGFMGRLECLDVRTGGMTAMAHGENGVFGCKNWGYNNNGFVGRLKY